MINYDRCGEIRSRAIIYGGGGGGGVFALRNPINFIKKLQCTLSWPMVFGSFGYTHKNTFTFFGPDL